MRSYLPKSRYGPSSFFNFYLLLITNKLRNRTMLEQIRGLDTNNVLLTLEIHTKMPLTGCFLLNIQVKLYNDIS